MDIIIKGKLKEQEAIASFQDVVKLLSERYHIHQFRELHVHLTLVDDQGYDVELVDDKNLQVFDTIEVVQHEKDLKKSSKPVLAIDNTRKLPQK